MTELNPHQSDAIDRAVHLHQDAQRFQQTWPTLNSAHDLTPPFTWSQLERQLSNLSATRGNAALVSDLMTATRKQAAFKPAELVLREILCIASAVMDETFSPPDREPSSSSPSEELPMR
jgi:hypothetical protein